MKKLIVILFLIFISNSFFPQNVEEYLFQKVDKNNINLTGQEKTSLSLLFNKGVLDTAYDFIIINNLDIITGNKDITINLGKKGDLTLHFVNQTKDILGNITKVYKADFDSYALIVYNGFNVCAFFQVGNEEFNIEPFNNRYYILTKVDYKKISAFNEKEDYNVKKDKKAKVTILPKSNNIKSIQSTPPYYVLDVLVVYTPAAEALGNISSLISQAIAQAEETYSNSGINIQMNLVYADQVNYTESGSLETDCNYLVGTNDGYMDEIHSLRTQYGADVCVLIVASGDNCGWADDILADYYTAFCVVKYGCAVNDKSFAHEIGHLQGGRHQYSLDSAGTTNHGYYHADIEENRWRTIMAIYDGKYGNTSNRIPYWSDPSAYYNGSVMGDEHSDNKEELNNTASTIYSFNPHVVSGVISSNTTWDGTLGNIKLGGDVTVNSGVTLTIQPDMSIISNSGAKLIIYGTLTASGATFQGNGSAGSWNSISFYSGSSGSVQSCTIKDAQCGIYATGANVTCSNNTITNNSLYGLSIINSSSASISGCNISNNGTGINIYSSTVNISDNPILNNSNYGIHAENVNVNYPWENNTLEGNSGYAMFLNNTSPILLTNMITGNGHGIVITSSSPSFGYRAGGSGYNAITCSSTPLFKAENYSDVYAGSDGGGNNSIFGSDLPDMEAVSYSSIDADNNYWGSQYPAIYADGTSEISANNPLPDDPNPGSSCMGKISASKDYAAILNAEDEDISNLYHQAHSYGNKKDYKTAKDLLKSIIYGKFDKKYSPLSLLDFYNFSIQEQQAKDSSSKSFESTKDYVDLVQELYRRPASDSLRPFAVRLLARGAALSNNHADLVKYNTEVVNNYPNSSNELVALYDLVSYYNQIENNPDLAGKYLTRMKALYPDEDLTLFAQINMGEKVDIYNRPNKNKNSETVKSVELYLNEAYPNPFNPTTTITYSLKERDQITLKVYNVLGKEVAKLVDGIQSEGEHSAVFNGSNLPSGIYVYKLTGRNFSISKKMLMIK